MWFDNLLMPIMWLVAWVMVGFHSLLTAIGLDPAGGTAWSLSIVGLTVVIRMALIPLFVRQIRASRGLQLIQPEMQAIQKKYKGKTDPASRDAMSREMMALYQKHNTNPFSSCLPILAQSPIFFALFRVLNSLTLLAAGTYQHGTRTHIGPLTQELAKQAESATLFGAPLSSTFAHSTDVATKVVTVVLVLAMSVTQFFTQRQLTMKNMPPAALEGPIAQQQKMLMYVMPGIFAISGINFPIGVLIYWTISNLWTMGQQFYTIRRMPAPGSAAEKAMLERRARKEAEHGSVVAAVDVLDEEAKPVSGQRQQPVRKSRAKKTGPRPTDVTRQSSAGTPTADKPADDRPSGDRSTGPRSTSVPPPPAGRGSGRDVRIDDDRPSLPEKPARTEGSGASGGPTKPRKPRSKPNAAGSGGDTTPPSDEPNGDKK